MAFAPPLLAPPAPEVQDQAAVANAIDPLALGASKVLPPPPLPEAASGLSTDTLMKAATSDYGGQLEPGNIDLTNRPHVVNPDGSVSTIRSLGVNIDGAETLIPTVSEDGRIMSDDEAIEQYKKTGRHLGKFDSVEASNAAAELLHNQQADLDTHPPGAAPGVAAAPGTPAEAAKANAVATEAVGKEQVANATEKAQLDAAAREEEAKAAAEKAQRLQALQDRQETHRQAAAHEVAAARAKAETEPFHTFWENRSIGQNIATGIGLILGGVSWNAGHVNRGVDMLNKAMELDLQLQKEKHADLWRAVNEAQEGQRTLDAEQLHELSAFSANEGAKHDALASRLMSAAAMNKGKGDVTAAKALAVKESAQAAKDWQNAETAAATANHLKELDAAKKLEDAERERYDKERNRIAEIRANKYKTKGGGHGGAGGHALETASLELKDKISELQKSGLKGLDLDKAIDKEAVRLKIPLTGKPNTLNARQIKADLIKEGAKGAQGVFGSEVTIKEPDASLAIRDKTGIRGYVGSKKDQAKFNAGRINYNQAIKSLEEMAKELKGGIVSGYDIARGNRWDNAVLAIASTTTAGATDTNVAHEAGTLKDKTGLVSLRAVEEKLQDLKSRQQEFYETLTPVPSDNPEISPLAQKGKPLHGGAGGAASKVVKPPAGSKFGTLSDGRAVAKYPDGTTHLPDGSEVTVL